MNNNPLNQAVLSSQNQQIMQLRELIKQSNDALQCGPTCQKIRKREELQQKYINAQTNVISAPDQLRQAQSNFLRFSYIMK